MKKSKFLTILVSAAVAASMSAAFADTDTELVLQINNPIMTVNGTEKEIDPGMGTSPVIVNDRTLLPVRAVIEEVGGTVGWNAEAKEVTLTYGEDEIRLVIDSNTAYLNDEVQTLDTAPTIINDRTMLPIRFIAESFDFDVDWDGATQTVIITKETESEPEPTAAPTAEPTAIPTTNSTAASTTSPTVTPTPDRTANQAAIAVTFGEGGEQYIMTVEDNVTTQFLLEYLGTSSLNLPVYHDEAYEGYEYYDIPSHYKIPDKPKAVTSVKAGEVYYADNQIILYYEDMDVKAEYTKIGTIEDTDGLEEAVISNPVLEGWGNKIISLRAIKAD
ncbi:MAG: hypothetical protein J1F64_08580 [Oscillospiraceae bacterium]|nr:hypothetical protein [Oscillospiraceae bacterium]